MIVELSVPAMLVATMIALPVLVAPFRALLGFRSDKHRSAIGWKRIPYLWFGSLWQMGGLAVMPFALLVLSGEQTVGPSWAGEVLAGRDAYDLILDAIDQGLYRPGDRLVESELADRFGVSRTPIREALQRLETQSLLTRDGRSLIVSSLDHNQMAELYVVRCELEGLAARLAARHATEEEVRVLEQIVELDPLDGEALIRRGPAELEPAPEGAGAGAASSRLRTITQRT